MKRKTYGREDLLVVVIVDTISQREVYCIVFAFTSSNVLQNTQRD